MEMHISKGHILSGIKRTVKNVDKHAHAMLYGSRAQNVAHDQSEWNILVILDKNSGLREKVEIERALSTFASDMGQTFDIHYVGMDEWSRDRKTVPLYESIRRQGIIL